MHVGHWVFKDPQNPTHQRWTAYVLGKETYRINGVNLPLSNSDILNRCLIEEFDEFSTTSADGKDGKDGKIRLERETKYLQEIRNNIPQIIGYIFDIISKSLEKFDEVDSEVNPTHWLADWVIWGETIARVLGYEDGEFLNAWNVSEVKENMSEGMRRYWQEMDEDQRKRVGEISRLRKSPEVRENMSKVKSKWWQELEPEQRTRMKDILSSNLRIYAIPKNPSHRAK
jgi:hypothetical protein